MPAENFSDAALVVLGHGSTKNDQSAAPVYQHAAELRRRGAIVDVVEAYHTVLPPDAAPNARGIFGHDPRPDWMTFTSSSTVKNLLRVVSPEELKGVKVASIGPVTSETARQLGLEIAIEASEFTVDGLVAALDQRRRRGGPLSKLSDLVRCAGIECVSDREQANDREHDQADALLTVIGPVGKTNARAGENEK